MAIREAPRGSIKLREAPQGSARLREALRGSTGLRQVTTPRLPIEAAAVMPKNGDSGVVWMPPCPRPIRRAVVAACSLRAEDRVMAIRSELEVATKTLKRLDAVAQAPRAPFRSPPSPRDCANNIDGQSKARVVLERRRLSGGA